MTNNKAQTVPPSGAWGTLLERIYEQQDVELAVKLGYTQFKHYSETGEHTAHMHLADYVLPTHPFERMGDHVVIRELVLDPAGNSAKNRSGKERIRAKLRMLPS